MKTISFATLFIALISNSVFALEADSFKGLTAQQALEKSHQYHQTGTAAVQVYPNELVAKFKDGSEIKIPTLDQHLLSIAPYEFKTHPCGYHVPTGCQGEMVEQEVMIKIVDLDTQEVLKEGKVSTQKDGFIDLWMPKNREKLEVAIQYKGKTSKQVLSTVGDAKTCITTMQLV